MKERPILMTPENAQKCFDGTKTQTRRIIREASATDNIVPDFGEKVHLKHIREWWTNGKRHWRCPYGQVGDRLWVREAFCQHPMTTNYWYKGDSRTDVTVKWKWKPAIHMPRWACRTVLEITDIRVERVQSISEEDAKAEGASFHDGHGIGHSGWRHDFKDVYADARSSFCALWGSINGPASWEENPWVWVIAFKKVLTP